MLQACLSSLGRYPSDFELTGVAEEVRLPQRVTEVSGPPMGQEFSGLEIVFGRFQREKGKSMHKHQNRSEGLRHRGAWV